VTPEESEQGSRVGAGDRYQGFWESVGREFPSLKGARSTAYYRECEIAVIREFLPGLDGASVFKTDLWDEAKNTEILVWVAEQGARVYGIDLSSATVQAARAATLPHPSGFVQGDVRAVPFADCSFDYVYSMGTVEHFPETEAAIGEIHRILRPGGRAVIGVPNRLDPFLRPALVRAMQWCGLYDYGAERSYSPAALRRMARGAGFRVLGLSGVLFLPGWLRMAELFAHARGWHAGRWLGATSEPFRAAYRRWPWIRRHGYLLALGVERPKSGT
jgi:SAM-dependent methyltransferase